MENPTPTPPCSPSARVSIDGGRIRFIRESKGLTQLYIATFLGVTPDTVSRWENRKYPTVKWENVEKLAEALQVDVAEILDQSDQGQQAQETKPAAAALPRKRPVLAWGVALALLLVAALLLVRFAGR